MSQIVCADEARTTILAQHEAIRVVLHSARAVADLAAAGNRRVAELLPHYLGDICTALDKHLAFEEQVLTPILEADLPLGPERARQLREEHRRQRAELADLQSAPKITGAAAESAASRLRRLV